MRPPWQRRAACRGNGTDQWFPTTREADEAARACASRARYGGTVSPTPWPRPELVGIWAGTEEAERRRFSPVERGTRHRSLRNLKGSEMTYEQDFHERLWSQRAATELEVPPVPSYCISEYPGTMSELRKQFQTSGHRGSSCGL